MARIPVKLYFDRFDIASALFYFHDLKIKLNSVNFVVHSVESVTRDARTDYKFTITAGHIRHPSYGVKAAKLVLECDLEQNAGVLTIDVGDPDTKDEINWLERLCLNCPKCGGESRLMHKMYEGAHIRRCLVCREYDEASNWLYCFTVQNLEGRPERRLTLNGVEDDPDLKA